MKTIYGKGTLAINNRFKFLQAKKYQYWGNFDMWKVDSTYEGSFLNTMVLSMKAHLLIFPIDDVMFLDVPSPFSSNES